MSNYDLICADLGTSIMDNDHTKVDWAHDTGLSLKYSETLNTHKLEGPDESSLHINQPDV